MKKFKIYSKVYVSMSVPISHNRTFVIPKKGNAVVLECKELPEVLKKYIDSGLITVEEFV